MAGWKKMKGSWSLWKRNYWCKLPVCVFEHWSSIKYANVCGRAIGYKYGNSDAFFESRGKTIDEIYVDGLSRSPHQHIWTYAAGLGDQPLGNHGLLVPIAFVPAILHA